jgi:VCBS repeat-containing protein
MKIQIRSGNADASFAGTVKIALEITSVTPSSGAASGGTLIEIKGTGFSENLTANTILLTNDSHICTIESVTVSAVEGDSTIMCRSPPLNADDWSGEDTVYILGRIQEEGVSCAGCKWNYAADDQTPTVASISPANAASGDTVTITGTNFSTDMVNVSVKLGGADATVLSSTATEI